MASFGTLLMVLVCAFALWKGDKPERHGAVYLAAIWLGTELLGRLLHYSSQSSAYLRVTLTLAGDSLLAIGFLVLAIRYGTLWLGAELIVQGAESTLHSVFMSDESGLKAYLLASNLLSLMLLVMLVLGTIVSWRRRSARNRGQTTARAAAGWPDPAAILQPA